MNHKQLVDSKFPSPAIITQHLLQFILLLLYYTRLSKLTGNAIKYNCILDIFNMPPNSTEKHTSYTAWIFLTASTRRSFPGMLTLQSWAWAESVFYSKNPQPKQTNNSDSY